MVGVVVRIRRDKGFCFLKVEGEDVDRFLHPSDLIGMEFNQIREGMVLDFEDSSTSKGPRAINARPQIRGAHLPTPKTAFEELFNVHGFLDTTK